MDQDINKLKDLLAHASKAAHAERPELPDDDLLVSLSEDGPRAGSISEANHKGEIMNFACMPCSFQSAYVISGSCILKCSLCDTEVWMSPATYKSMLKFNKSRIVCLQCLLLAQAEKEQVK